MFVSALLPVGLYIQHNVSEHVFEFKITDSEYFREKYWCKYAVPEMTEAASSSCAKYARDSPPQPVLERCIEELPITQIQTVANH